MVVSLFNSLDFSHSNKLLPNQLFQLYRNRANLTQQQLAHALGLKSYQAVGFWEEGRSLPRAANLRNLIKTYLFLGVFSFQHERNEALELWLAVKNLQDAQLETITLYPTFDEKWFNTLLQEYNTNKLLDTTNKVKQLKLSAVNQASEVFQTEDEAKTTENNDEPIIFSNLPKPLTKLVGREKEISALTSYLLRPEVRLLTLNGPGGAGKTRLAIELGNNLPLSLQKQFKDGIFFVDLSSVTDADAVLFSIAQILEINETDTNQALIKLLKNYFRYRKILLILDNFEQIIKATPLIMMLLSETNFLKIVVTTREILRCKGEHNFEVLPLELPDEMTFLHNQPENANNTKVSDNLIEGIAQVPSVALFLQCAQAVSRDFRITVQNSETVIKLCQCLDGLPLAIELACYHLKTLTAEQLLIKLKQPLQVLEDKYASPSNHQQTLRKTLDWSYELLTKNEQVLLNQLAVFAGSFTLEDVEAIAQLPDEAEIWKNLEELVNKSLVSRVEITPSSDSPDGLVLHYFKLLNTIKDYGLEQLQKSTQEIELRRTHADYYAKLAEIATSNLTETNSQLDLRQLELELDNLRAALNWSLETREGGLCYRLLSNLWRFWRFWGLLSEGRNYLERALNEKIPSEITQSLSVDQLKLSDYSETLYGAGILAIRQHDFAKATEHLQCGFDLALSISDNKARAKFLCALGELNRRQALYQTASIYYQQSLELYSNIGDKAGIALVYHNMGVLAFLENNQAIARRNYEEALSIWEELDSKLGVSGTTNSLAELALTEGNYPEAKIYSQRSLALKLQLGDKTGKARLFTILGYVFMSEKQYSQAAELFWNSLELLKMVEDKANLARCLVGLGFLSLAQGDKKQAEKFFLESMPLKQKESTLGSLVGLFNLLAEQKAIIEAVQLAGTIQKLMENNLNNSLEFYKQAFVRVLDSIKTTCDFQEYQASWQAGYSTHDSLDSIQDIYYTKHLNFNSK